MTFKEFKSTDAYLRSSFLVVYLGGVEVGDLEIAEDDLEKMEIAQIDDYGDSVDVHMKFDCGSMFNLVESWLANEGIFGYMTKLRKFLDACGIALYNVNTGEIQEAMDDFKY